MKKHKIVQPDKILGCVRLKVQNLVQEICAIGRQLDIVDKDKRNVRICRFGAEDELMVMNKSVIHKGWVLLVNDIALSKSNM